MAQRRCRECDHTSHTWGIREQRQLERLQGEAIPFEGMQRCSRNRIYTQDQVVGCEEAVVVGGTAAAVAVAAATDVPVGTAAAVAKGLTNAASVFDHFRVPTALAAAFHHSPRNRQNHYIGRRSPPRGLAESHRQRARGDRAGPPGRERSTALPHSPCDWHMHCEQGALPSLAGIQLGLRR